MYERYQASRERRVSKNGPRGFLNKLTRDQAFTWRGHLLLQPSDKCVKAATTGGQNVPQTRRRTTFTRLSDRRPSARV